MFDKNIKYSSTLWQAFVIDGRKLKRLVKLLEHQIGSATFSVDFAHNVSYRYETVEELLNYENAKSKEIERISIHAKSDDYSKSAVVLFHKAMGVPSVAISLEVSHDALRTLLDEIHDMIRGMRPWYDGLARWPYLYSLVITALVMVMEIPWFTEYMKEYISGTTENFAGETRDMILALCALLFAGVMWWSFYNLLRFVFPSSVYAIGQGKDRFNRMKWFHGIILTVTIALVFFVMTLVMTS